MTAQPTRGEKRCACGAALGPKNKTGLCRSCRCRQMVASSDFKAKQKAGVAAYFADPAVRAVKAALMAERNRNRPAHEIERARDHGRRQVNAYLHTPEGRAKAASPEASRKKGQSVSNTRYADIPPHLRDEVRRLNRQQKIPAAEARRIVLEQAAAEERRRVAAMPPLERQLERVRKGARVVEKWTPPSVDPLRTLGGVSGGML